MDYATTKLIHISCVSLSISLFTLRGGMQLAGVNWRQWRVLRIAPHIVDSALLASAIWLAMTIHQYPFVNGWLTAKVLALCGYVWFGKRALRARPDEHAGSPGNAVMFAPALMCATYIVGVAITHSPTWGLGSALR
jgi:uncharacterized membrane protein SirB2